MEHAHIQTSPKKLLLNAESFGYGPSAAVASFFPHLRERFDYIGYVGAGHTLDIQNKLPYDDVHDLSNFSFEKRSRAIRELAKHYDLFFTAMDFPMLEEVKAQGLETAGYDALAWYWPELPKGALQSDMYLAQDFFGVTERLQENSAALNAHASVPPIVPSPEPRKEREHVLINMGGLLNPYWSIDDAAMYASKVTTALKSVLPSDVQLVVTTSAAISEKIGGNARVYSRAEMQEILVGARFAFMTPGLGNIYDASVYDIPTIWLPPANDSQGRQLGLLSSHDMTDGYLDWDSCIRNGAVSYESEQESVLQDISARVHALDLAHLEALFEMQLMQLDEHKTSKVVALIAKFGTNGDRVVAKKLHEFAEGVTSSA